MSADEQERAAKYHFERDRTRFIIARAALRRLLGGYLRCTPREIAFALGKQGKPHLQAPGGTRLRFNLSHSHERALFAFALDVDVGVDVEHWRENLNAVELADRFFFPAEAAEVRQANATDLRRVFCACWSRKEACMKALGLGLQLAPESFHVGARAAAPTESITLFTGEKTESLVLYAVPELGGYGSALASMGTQVLAPEFFAAQPVE